MGWKLPTSTGDRTPDFWTTKKPYVIPYMPWVLVPWNPHRQGPETLLAVAATAEGPHD